jgi:hypothetical protein
MVVKVVVTIGASFVVLVVKVVVISISFSVDELTELTE